MKYLFNNKITTRRLIGKSLFLLLVCLAFDLKSEGISDDFLDMSLEQLADINITSVAKKPQKLSLAASSIFVLSQEDIKRSGVTTIPDALRMVPGVQVAKLDANKWAISIRGFNDVFSNKLLVLMDGRSVYSPFFGGAYWDTVDTVLDDVERIEVIKGPGGTLWGSNAVNGVINIITKHAKDSSGLLVNALAGNEEKGQLSMRYGGELDQDTQYRVYVKGFEKDEAKDGADDWRMGRTGFRVDSKVSKKDNVTLQSDVYAGEEGERATPESSIGPFRTFESKTDVFGANVLFRWQRDLSEDSNFILQTYYDYTEREHFYVKDQRETVDIDFQHRFQTFWQQEFIWGLGFRYIGDEISPGSLMTLSPEKRVDNIYSGFVQDEISLIDEQLILTLGTKVEHNSYTGFEFQPSARLLWKPFELHSFWGSVSRAVKVPNRIESDSTIQRAMASPTVAINIYGSEDMDAEELIAYEIGYRFLGGQFTFDSSFFYNKYDNLRSLERGAIIPGSPNIVPLVIDNELYGEVYGLELAASWQVNNNWQLNAGYSFTQVQLHLREGSTDKTEEEDEGDTPHHQATIRSLWQITQDWQFDTTLRYVDMIKEGANKEVIDSYVAVDLRLAWQAYKALEISFVGQNLFDSHREFRGSTVETQATDVEPSLFFQAKIQY